MYAKIENGEVVQYPVSGTDIRRANPNTSFPVGPLSDEVMREHGCVPVSPTAPPALDELRERLEKTAPVKVGDEWVQHWAVVPISDAERIERTKATREVEVAALKVTTASGKTFDADETAQERMSRAITALDPEEITIWVLADNTPTQVTREELREAMRLAGEAQTAIWVRPYQ